MPSAEPTTHPAEAAVGALRLFGLGNRIDLGARVTAIVEEALGADRERIDSFVRIDAANYLLYLRNRVEEEAQFDANFLSEELRQKLDAALKIGPDLRVRTVVLSLPLHTLAAAIGAPATLLNLIDRSWTAKKERELAAAEALRAAAPAAAGAGKGANLADITYGRDDIDNALAGLSPVELDTLPFGVIKITRQGTILHFNKKEGQLTNLVPGDIIGRNFFRDIAPCTNRREFLGQFVAGAKSGKLDVKFNYLFDFRMKPRRVTVHLKKSYHDEHYWILIDMAGEEPA
jgi:photoactive yellow protein